MDKPTQIYFMRHGEVHNPKKILYGRLPRFTITNDAIKKIIESVVFFNSQKIDQIYSSPLLRTRVTAKIIADTIGVKVRYSRQIIEVNIIFQGKSLDDYKNNIQPDLYSDKYIKMGQESIEEITARMKKFVNYLLIKHKGEKILVVSHGDPILIYKAFTLKQEFTWEYKRKNYLKTGEWISVKIKNDKYGWS